MTSTDVLFPEFQALVRQGFDLAVLLTMQENLLAQTIEVRTLTGEHDHPAEEVWAATRGMLPAGLELQQQYLATQAAMKTQPLQVLQRAATHLSRVAALLQFKAAQAIQHPVTLRRYAEIQQSMGERYARILQAARTLERAGVIPVYLTGDLAQLSDRPKADDPLDNFYDKAVSILAESDVDADMAHERSTLRMRAA